MLVKGWSAKSTWGFPKGKIGKDEVPSDCAIREVFEETGFNISPLLTPSNFIEASIGGPSGQSTRLFIIPGVPESTPFAPQTRKEISKIQWHPVEALPTKYGQDNSFYNVIFFVKKLKVWIKNYRKTMLTIPTMNSKNKINQQTHSQTQCQTNQYQSQAHQSQYQAHQSQYQAHQSQYQPQPQYHQPQKKLKKPQFNQSTQDIFDKLRSKNENDYSPINSVLMRDNPSPIHLFEKLTLNLQSESDKMEMETETEMEKKEIASVMMDPKMKLFKSIETFAISLKSLKVNRSLIRESVNKTINF